MLIEPGMEILRVHTVKRIERLGRFEVYQNRKDFLFTGEFSEFYAAQVADRCALAEQHLLMPEVEIMFQAAYWFSPFNPEGGAMKCQTLYRRQRGGRNIDAGDVVVDWPMMLKIGRYPEYGRAGHLMYRGALRDRDLTTDVSGNVGLGGAYNTVGLAMAYYRAFMKETVYPAVICGFPGGAPWPVTVRVIEDWGAEKASRLTSVAQAQSRKTLVATSYRYQAYDLGDKLTSAGEFFANIGLYAPPDVDFAVVEQLKELFRQLGIDSQALLEYWKSGLDLNIAPCWRPTAGLDPYSLLGRESLSKMVLTIAQIVQALSALEPGELGTVPKEQITSIFPLAMSLAPSYALMLERTRFTGTPIPHPNAPGMCNA